MRVVRGMTIENSHGRLLTVTGQGHFGGWWVLHDSGRARPYSCTRINQMIDDGFWTVVAYPELEKLTEEEPQKITTIADKMQYIYERIFR